MYPNYSSILRSALIIFIGLCIINTTSCSVSGIKALSTFKKPIFTYKKYRIVSVGEKKADIDLIFDATNPNDISIDSLFANYELFIKEESFIKGKDVQLKLIANGKSEVRIPVEIFFKQALKGTQNTITSILKKDKKLPVTAKIKVFGNLVYTDYISLSVSYSEKIDLSVPIPQGTSKQLKDKLEEKLRKLF